MCLLAVVLSACAVEPAGGAGLEVTDASDVGADPGDFVGDGLDGLAPETPDGAGETSEVGEADERCDSPASGLSRRPFVVGDEPARPGALAADFEVETLVGRFSLSERWTGCASVVVFVHFPGITEGLWRSDAARLFADDPATVHYLFVSDAEDPEQRVADLLTVERSIAAGIAGAVRDPATRERWREHIHHVVGRARELEGGIGDYVRGEIAYSALPESRVDLGERGVVGLPAPVVFAIGPDQRFDPGDNLAPAVGLSSTLSMAGYLAPWLRWRELERERVASEPGPGLVLVDRRTTERVIEASLALPEDLGIERLDDRDDGGGETVRSTRAVFEVEVECEERNPFACSEWDRIASIALCDQADCGSRRELARWITPYWRRGLQRYALEVSHLLPLLVGGETTFRVELGPEWERPTAWRVKIVLRLGHDASGEVAARGVIASLSGGAFDATYGPRTLGFEVPLEATRVRLFALVTGHGQTGRDNCAEWCDHRHAFAIDGRPVGVIAHQGAIGSMRGCAERSAEGVMPGQWGNWAQERAYWCPGMGVGWRVLDLTDEVAAGREHLLMIEGFLGADGAPPGGDVALSTYVVWD